MNFALLTLDLYLATMLGISGLAKLDDLDYFASTLHHHRILPKWSIYAASRLVPWVEVIVALLLIIGELSIATSIVVLALFVIFLITETILVITKRATNCGCYGVAYPQKVDGASIVVSLVLVALAGFHLWLVMSVAPVDIAWRLPIILTCMGAGGWLVRRMMARHHLYKQRLAEWNRILQLEHSKHL